MKKSIAVSFLFLLAFLAKAGWENPKSTRITPYTASPNTLQATAVIDVKDDKFPTPVSFGWDNGYLNNNVVNKIILGIDANQSSVFHSAYIIDAEFMIETWDAAGNHVGPFAINLSISYDPAISSKEDLRTVYNLSGYHRVKVTVVDFINRNTGLSDFPKNIYVENFLQVERFYTVDPTSTQPGSSFASNVGYTGTLLGGQELEVSWDPLSASETPEAYELEWTVSQDYQANVGSSPTFNYIFNVNFKNNATNVIITDTKYRIPLIYEFGLMMWRVRAIYVDHNNLNEKRYSEWSCVDVITANLEQFTTVFKDEGGNTLNNSYLVQGFDEEKNWQYSISFAEQGKNKTSITYYDGALRSRQSITRVNSDGNAIVGQTIYDFTGRPAIQVLPVPVVNNLSLGYKESFNKSSVAGNPGYNWKHFDVDATGNCAISKTHSMSTISGSSQYYSISSTGVSQLGGDRIPQAEGYPFAQVEYMPDNTGRVRRQGGLGLEHRLTGTDENNTSHFSHESKYFYGTPSGQRELYRLFGNEIGSYKHYKKNMVIDPNGQVSISYLDPQGRVVATALAGEASNTPNLDDIPSSFENLWEEYENTEVDYNDYTLTSHRTILVEKAGLQQFYYKLAAPRYTDACMPVNYCFDCMYDIEISIKDNCGQDLVIPENLKYLSGVLNPPNIPSLNTTCSDSIILELRPDALGGTYEPFTVNLEVGMYTVYKKLTVSKTALEYYKQQYLENLSGECNKTYEDFVVEEKAKLDYTKCNYTCNQCYIDAGGDPEKVAQCDEFCQAKDQCFGLYIQMKQDMSPGGQYFDNTINSFVGLNSDIDLTDASFTYDGSSSTINYWLNRRAPANSSVKNGFFSGFNTRFAVGGVPQFNDWGDIRERWKPEFADELAKLHPEYCYYEKCLEIQESYQYDQKLLSITDGTEAVTKGYFNPIQMSSPDVSTSKYPQPTNDERDPFFFNESGPKSPEWATMRGYLINYEGSFGNVWAMVDANQIIGDIEAGDPIGCLSDYDWIYFRSLYLAEKQKMYKAFYQSCDLDDPVVDGGETKNQLIHDATPLTTSDPDRKIRRFYLDAYGAFDKYGIDYTTNPVPNPFGTTDFCDDQCTENVKIWLLDLQGCGFSSTHLDMLETELEEICNNSCNEGSEIGASSSSYYTANGNRTFEDAINWIIQLGGYSKSDVCNPLLVNFPAMEKPHQPLLVPLDDCACNKIIGVGYDYYDLLNEPNLSPGVCSETELFIENYGVELDNFQLLKCICLNNKNRYSEDTSGLCYDNYGGFINNCPSDGVTLKARAIYAFIEHLIKNYDLDDPNSSAILDARASIPNFFGTGSLFYPNAGDINCIPLVEIGESYFDSDGDGDFITRPITISDNCGFSCVFTIKLYYTEGPESAFASLESSPESRVFTSSPNDVIISFEELARSMIISTCFNDLQCNSNGFLYPQAFVPASIACKKCMTCDDLSLAFSTFKQNHPYLFEPKAQSEIIGRFTQYLNTSLGYHYTSDDVENLFTQCTQNTTCSTNASATALTALLNKMALRNDLGKVGVDLNSTDYPELYNPAIYSGSPSNAPQIANNNPINFITYSGNGAGSDWTAGSFLYSVTYPANVIDGVNYPVILKITALATTTQNTYIYIGDSLGGGNTYIIPPLTAGQVYFINTLATPYVVSGSPSTTLLDVTGFLGDFTFGQQFSIPFGTVLNNFNPVLSNTHSFTITDNNGFNCTITLEMPDGLLPENIQSITSIFPDPYAIAGSNVMKAKVLMKGSTIPIEVYIHSTCHTLTNCGSLSAGVNKCPSPIDFSEPDPCTARLNELAEKNAWDAYNQYRKTKGEEFEQNYIQLCMQPFESFGAAQTVQQYQVTLYYYDQADNLIKTVPPKGVKLLNTNSVDSCISHEESPASKPRILPNHYFITHYKYNTLNQLVEQITPDAGTSKFWYDRLGRLVLSQNEKQKPNDYYSYTLFDAQGRITEVGQLTSNESITAANVANESWLASTISSAISTSTEITKTFYDAPLLAANTVPGFEQDNLRKRVATVAYYENYTANNLQLSNATHYAYDATGNVNQVVQDNPELNRFEERFKAIHYNYDYISGNVNMVAYQPDSLDQFYHYYNYDDDNRLQAVYTSRNANWAMLQAQQLPDIPNSPDWVLDGKQQYFWHGPMVRAELGEQQVQGLDYTYTLQGWLKAINSTFGTPTADGNQDGYNVWSFAQDAFGFELGYYNGDYEPVSNRPFDNVIATQTGSSLQSLQTSLYNGNISYSVTSLPDSLQYTNLQLEQQPKASLYKYDQLNRLTKSLTLDLAASDVSGNLWKSGFSTVPEFSVTNISYDANGNIMALNRNAEALKTDMDALSYHYDGNTNKLLYVDDNTAFTTYHGEDIDDQAPNNYAYDAIGNLIQDNAEEIATIEWTVYGKVKSITRTALSQRPDLEFTYNALGQRLSKKVIPKNGDKPTTTYYIYNAGGDCMATYKHTDINTSGIYYTETFKAEEYTIYGASRLGVETVNIQLYEHTYSEIPGGGISTITEDYFTPTPQTTYTIQLGNKNYELNNHLGNVLVTITDRKIAINGGGSIDYHLPDIASVTDYYPFGMRIETRSWNITKYRFGFNGQEKDNEVAGEGNSYTAEYWQYDPRLGRRFNIDPVRKEWESPYATFRNNPIQLSDPFGDDVIYGDKSSSRKDKRRIRRQVKQRMKHDEEFKTLIEEYKNSKENHLRINDTQEYEIIDGQKRKITAATVDAANVNTGFNQNDHYDYLYWNIRLLEKPKGFLFDAGGATVNNLDPLSSLDVFDDLGLWLLSHQPGGKLVINVRYPEVTPLTWIWGPENVQRSPRQVKRVRRKALNKTIRRNTFFRIGRVYRYVHYNFIEDVPKRITNEERRELGLPERMKYSTNADEVTFDYIYEED